MQHVLFRSDIFFHCTTGMSTCARLDAMNYINLGTYINDVTKFFLWGGLGSLTQGTAHSLRGFRHLITYFTHVLVVI